MFENFYQNWTLAAVQLSDESTGNSVRLDAATPVYINGIPIAKYPDYGADTSWAIQKTEDKRADAVWVRGNRTIQVSIKANGYQPFSESFEIKTSVSKPQTLTCVLEPAGPAGAALTIKFASPNDKINGVVVSVTAQGQEEPLFANQVSAGGVVAISGVPPGAYTLDFDCPEGFEADPVPVPLDKNDAVVTVVLRKTSGDDDSAGESEDPELPAEDPGDESSSYVLNAARTVLTGLDRDVAEDVYRNSSFDRYFTSAQAKLFIGNLFIDELYSLQYLLQANSVPLYGYADRDPAAFAQGRCLVQGQITINYITDGYLYTVVDEYRKKFLNADSQGRGGELAELLAAGRSIAAGASEIVSETAASFDLGRAIKTRVDQLLADPNAVAGARARLRRETGDLIYRNACYEQVVFDMKIQIGEGAAVSNRYIEKCRLTSNEQVLGPDGQPLFETYAFEARRLR